MGPVPKGLKAMSHAQIQNFSVGGGGEGRRGGPGPPARKQP